MHEEGYTFKYRNGVTQKQIKSTDVVGAFNYFSACAVSSKALVNTLHTIFKNVTINFQHALVTHRRQGV